LGFGLVWVVWLIVLMGDGPGFRVEC
jgi:hypothetical protein